ncbi:MAG: hypothetical protein V3T77_03090, partial [Planctomycetota bacterium]
EVAAVGELSSGRVIDARTGAPLSGVKVWITFSHSDDGYPPLPWAPRDAALTDAEGHFQVPVPDREDARLKVHLQAERPGYQTQVLVIEQAPDLTARWTFVTLALREAVTRVVTLLDPQGHPLPHAAVEIRGAAADRFLGEDAWEGDRSYRSNRAHIRYSDSRGTLLCTARPTQFSLRHPTLYLLEEKEMRPTLTVLLDPDENPHPLEGDLKLITRQDEVRDYQLLDGGGNLMVDCLVEIHLGGMPPVRLYTGSQGELSFAPRPHDRFDAATFDNPRVGTLTCLDPSYWKDATSVVFPNQTPEIHLDAFPAPRLRLQLRELPEDTDSNEPGPPIPADQLRINADLTLVRRTAAGEAFFVGPLPLPGSEIVVHAAGCLPATVPIPPYLAGTEFLDLQEVLLEPGETLRVRLQEGHSTLYSRARLNVFDQAQPELSQQARFDATGKMRLRGMQYQHTYKYSLEGSQLPRVDGAFRMTPGLHKEGLVISLEDSLQVELTVDTEVIGVEGEHSLDFRVVERYYLEDHQDPVTFHSYPVTPRGRIGSRRILHRPRHAEIFVVGSNLQGAYVFRGSIQEPWTLNPPSLELEPLGHALFTFYLEGDSSRQRVRVPANLTLYADENSYHQVARLRTLQGGWLLLIENLMPGRYLLEWGWDEKSREEYEFTIENRQQAMVSAIPRQPFVQETYQVRVVDSFNRPVKGASLVRLTPLIDLQVTQESDEPTIRPSPLAGKLLGELARIGFTTNQEQTAGTAEVVLVPGGANQVLAQAPGTLNLLVHLPAGVSFPDPLVLPSGVPVRGRIETPEGFSFDGDLQVTWKELHEVTPGLKPEPRPTLSGAPFQLRILNGILESSSLPPGTHVVTLRDLASEASATQVWDLSARDVNLLRPIRLQETRSIRGLVLLPDGTPAAGAEVALVQPERAYRLPMRPLSFDKLRFAARVNPLGQFRIDGLPLEFDEELALVAHLDGTNDAVEDPVDLAVQEHSLKLNYPTELLVQAGYHDREIHDDYEFRLEYSGIAAGDREILDLGPVSDEPAAQHLFQGITPGVYQVSWRLKNAPPWLHPTTVETPLNAGERRRLRYIIEDEFVVGEASFNGTSLNRGWILVTDNPGNPLASRFGRVRGGGFEVAVSPSSRELHASLIPQRTPQPVPNFDRGEALPIPAPQLLRDSYPSFSYVAYNLAIEFTDSMLAEHANLQIEFPHYIWRRGEFIDDRRGEAIRDNPFWLHLVPPGIFSYRIVAPRDWKSFRSVEIQKNVNISFRR